MAKKKVCLNKNVLMCLSDPNPWTPEKEDEWLKQPAIILKKYFPPMKKPPHVMLQGKRYYG